MKKLILIAAVAAVSVLASCGSKTNCVCVDKDGKQTSNFDYKGSGASSSQIESACSSLSSLQGLFGTGGSCSLK